MSRPDTDGLLMDLLDSVSASKARTPLTVFCGGLAVSGTAVADEVYLQRIGLSNLANDTPMLREEQEKQLDEILAELNRDDISSEARQALLSQADELQRKFIMMVDVTILGAGPTPITAAAWRGRLSQISGWILGALEESE